MKTGGAELRRRFEGGDRSAAPANSGQFCVRALEFVSMRRFPLHLALFVALLAEVAGAQTSPTASVDERLRVYLDCPSGGCDRNFIVNEHPYAIWTQDRLDADVHLLITRLGTGAGGDAYTLQFIARRRLEPDVDTLAATVPPNVSDDQRRRVLARSISLGLAADAAKFSDASQFTVAYAPPDDEDDGVAAQPSDPWDLWIYRVRLNGNGSAESRASEYEVSGGVSAARVTDTWKLSFEAEHEYESEQFTLRDGTDRQFILRSVDMDARVVRSVTEHWSIGSQLTAGLSEFRNQDAFVATDLSAEYNIFPWSEATSRQLVGIAALGGELYDYRDVTLFGRLHETRPVAKAIVAGESRQAWGTLDGSLRYKQYLHDLQRYNVSFYARGEFRLSRGLALEVSAEAAKVQDQLYLPRGEVSDDEVLTRQRALATAYRLSASVDISFTFGSIYNSIVNPRLNELGN